jgi:hypothetical protein
LRVPSGDVVHAVQKALKEQDSAFVAARNGGLTLRGKVHKSGFRIWLGRSWLVDENAPELRVTITGGGSNSAPSLAVARISRAHNPWAGPALFLAIALVSSSNGGRIAMAAMAVVILAIDLLRRARVEDDGDVRYLDAWLTAVLEPLRLDRPASPDGGRTSPSSTSECAQWKR